jgi:hypothetical protein
VGVKKVSDGGTMAAGSVESLHFKPAGAQAPISPPIMHKVHPLLRSPITAALPLLSAAFPIATCAQAGHRQRRAEGGGAPRREHQEGAIRARTKVPTSDAEHVAAPAGKQAVKSPPPPLAMHTMHPVDN